MAAASARALVWAEQRARGAAAQIEREGDGDDGPAPLGPRAAANTDADDATQCSAGRAATATLALVAGDGGDDGDGEGAVVAVAAGDVGARSAAPGVWRRAQRWFALSSSQRGGGASDTSALRWRGLLDFVLLMIVIREMRRAAMPALNIAWRNLLSRRTTLDSGGRRRPPSSTSHADF